MELLQHHEESHTFSGSGIPNSMILISNTTSNAPLVPATAFGHMVAGTSWVLLGFLYVIAAHNHYYDCLSTSTKFVSSMEIPLDCLPGRLKNWPIGAILKIVLAGGNLIMELVTALFRPPGGDETPYWQHDVISVAFVMSGIVDIFSVQYLKRHGARMQYIPDACEYIVFAISFGMEAGLMYTHLHKRTPLDVRVHLIQVAIAASCFMAILIEAKFRSHPMMPVMRGYFIMLHGTWVIHLLVVLYYPFTKERVYDLYLESTKEKVSLAFPYHVMLNLVLVLAVNLLFVRAYSRKMYTFEPLSHEKNRFSHNGVCSWGRAIVQNGNSTPTHQENDADDQSETFVDFDNQSDNEFEMTEPAKPRKP